MQAKLTRLIPVILATALLGCGLTIAGAGGASDRSLAADASASGGCQRFRRILKPEEKEALEARCRQVREKTGRSSPW